MVVMPGCIGKKKTAVKKMASNTEQFSDVSIPVADEENIKSLFDEDISEFTLVDEDSIGNDDIAGTDIHCDAEAIALNDEDDFSWVEDNNDTDLKVVYFDFNKYSLRADQEEALNENVKHIKNAIQEAEKAEQKYSVVIEGHACSSAGSRVYNLALSEKRAKSVVERLVASGIPENCIKVVGRGQEVPAIVDGEPVMGDRDQQWPNRRDEIRFACA